MNNYLKTTSKTYKICSEYFNKNQLLIWINLFDSLSRLRELLELKLSHNLPIDFLQLKEIERKKIKNDTSITLEKYIDRYDYKAHRLYKEYVKSKCKGWHQPGINHDSKSLEFCIKKFGIEKGKEEHKRRCFDCGKPTRLQYFIDKGLTEEEAKIALKERQSTFSLKKCFEKYGEIEGTKRWKERQDKWQNTLNSKSEEEKIKINMSKSSGKNNVSNKNGYCLLYYIRFYNNEDNFNVWKIGITGKSVEERFKLNLLKVKHNLDYEIKFVQKFETVDEAYSKEQYILNAFSDNRIYTDYNGFTTSETFNKDVLEGNYEINI